MAGVSSPRLSETSYIVLSLVERLQPATPYDLKQLAQQSTVNFWNVPHTQLYTESARLAREGLLSEEREQGGRRRRIYRITHEGMRVLTAWRATPTSRTYELRDVGILKLFLGADPQPLARAQLQSHRDALEHLERQHGELLGAPVGWRLALEAGIGHEREFIRFWSGVLAGGGPGADG